MVDVDGKTVVITGTFELKRNELKTKLEALGANVTGSVSKKTDILFAGIKSGSKLDKANEFGVAVYGEKELMSLLGLEFEAKDTEPDIEVRATTSSLDIAGKKVCITGKLQTMTRDEARIALEELGAVTTGSVSSKTDLLFVGEGAGSKLRKAKELGIDILTEVEFNKIVHG